MRMINFDIRFDINDWARFAEEVGIEGRAINFFLNYSHELTESKNGNMPIANARSYTMFANTISGIKDWSTTDSLALIMQIASGCFIDKDNLVGSLFTTFIANKLDKLVTPEDMLLEDWDKCKKRVQECVYKNDVYRADIAAILQTRLMNYIRVYFEKGGETKVVQDRILAFIDASENKDTMLFTEDLIFDIAKTLIKEFPSRCNKFMINSKIRKRIM